MILHKYQKKDSKKIRKALKKYNHVLFCGATGYGKTVLLGQQIADLLAEGTTVLVIVPRVSLISQFKKTLLNFGIKNVHIGIHQGINTKTYKSARVHIASTSTLSGRMKKKGKDYIGHVDNVFVDEVHINFRTAIMKPIEKQYWDDAKWLGVSATPIDNKGYKLEGYDVTIADTQTIDLVEMDRLLPLDVYIEDVPDLSNVKVSALGDYQLDSLEDAMNQSSLITNVYDVWAKKFGHMKTMVLCVDIKHAENVTEEFTKNGIKAEVYHSKQSDKEDKRILKEFKEGKIQVLVSVSKLTTGFDEPSVECLIALRPTRVLSLYIQSVGRVLRKHPSMSKAVLIDCAGWVESFGHPFTRRNFNKKKPELKAIEDEILSADQTSEVKCPICKELIMTSELGIKIKEKKKYTKITKLCPLCDSVVDETTIKKRKVKKLKKYKAPKPKKVTVDEMYNFLEYLGRQAGYKDGWAYHKMKMYTNKTKKEMDIVYNKVYNDQIKDATAIANIKRIEGNIET